MPDLQPYTPGLPTAEQLDAAPPHDWVLVRGERTTDDGTFAAVHCWTPQDLALAVDPLDEVLTDGIAAHLRTPAADLQWSWTIGTDTVTP